MSLRQVLTAGCVLAAAFVLAAPAAAQQTPTQAQYADTVVQVGQGGGGDAGGPSADEPSNVGSLPFTGLDLALMGVAATALVAGGLVIRRRSHAPGDHTA
jgi:hypothetical protein